MGKRKLQSDYSINKGLNLGMRNQERALQLEATVRKFLLLPKPLPSICQSTKNS